MIDSHTIDHGDRSGDVSRFSTIEIVTTSNIRSGDVSRFSTIEIVTTSNMRSGDFSR